MFRCHVIKELSAYLDNQLSDKQKIRIGKHLQECVLCSNELLRLKVLSEKLKTWHAPGLDADFDNSVRNEIVRRELEKGAVKMKKNTLFILVPSSVLAALLMFAFVGNFYLRRGFQGRLADVSDGHIAGRYRESRDDLGERFDPKKYEPYYQKSEVVPVYGIKKSASSQIKNNFSNGKKEIQIVRSGAPKNRVAGNYENSLKGSYESYEEQHAWVGTGVDSAETKGLQKQTETNLPVETPLDNSSVIVIQPVLPATGEGDKIIRTGTIKLEVENGKETYKNASLICQELGGYMSSSNFYKDSENRESGTITMRIPKEKFTLALDRLSALGKVENIDTNSQDVSQEYANLKSEMDAAMVIYNKMLDALQKRQVTIPEAIRIESELTPVLKRVQKYKNQLEALNNAVSYTTVTVTFHESKVSAKVLEESKKLIQEGMLTAKIKSVKIIAQMIPNIVGFVFLTAIIVAVAFLIKYAIIKLFKRG